MVVLDTDSSSTVTSTTNSRMQSYYNSQYVQPLPHEVRLLFFFLKNFARDLKRSSFLYID